MSWAIEEKGYSQRRACGLIVLEPKTYRYASTRGDDAAVRVRLRGLAGERRRFGYRRLLILLRREGSRSTTRSFSGLPRGTAVGAQARGRKRALARERRPRCRRSRTSAGASTSSPTRSTTDGASASSSWSMTARGSAWHWWSTRRCLDSGVARELDRIIVGRGKPLMIRLGQRHRADLARHPCAGRRSVRLSGTTSPPGKPQQNGFVESLNGRLRDECLNEHLFP